MDAHQHRAAGSRGAAVIGPNLGLESGFKHCPGACSRNWRRDADELAAAETSIEALILGTNK
jgi:hypothetical protein